MEYSKEFKAAVREEAARQGRDIDPEEIGAALDLLTNDVCAEYMNEVKRNVAVELDKVRTAEEQVQRKQAELDDLYDEIKAALAECKESKDAAPASGCYLPGEMMAVSNLFTIMTDNAISRGVSPDLAVSKVSYMLNAYLGGGMLPDEVQDNISEYCNPDMEVARDDNPDVDLPWDSAPRQTYPGGGNNRGGNNRGKGNRKGKGYR